MGTENLHILIHTYISNMNAVIQNIAWDRDDWAVLNKYNILARKSPDFLNPYIRC
jgi:hypothetical protein